MKYRHLLLALPFSVLGCQSPDAGAEQQKETEPEESLTTIVQTATTGENEEYLEPHSIRINGKYPLTTSVKNIISLLGKPDSVNTINWGETCSSDFRSENSKIAYYRGVEFEQFGDSLNFQTINFSKHKSLFLQHGNLKLDSNTTLEEISKHYPKAVKDIDKESYLVDGQAADSIILPPSKELSDGHWILMFQNGKLVRIDDWFPC